MKVLIEERKQAELYLAEGGRLAHMGSWSFTPSGICDYWSRELYEILGFDPAKGILTLADYLALVHSEDREAVRGTINKKLGLENRCAYVVGDMFKQIPPADAYRRFR